MNYVDFVELLDECEKACAAAVAKLSEARAAAQTVGLEPDLPRDLQLVYRLARVALTEAETHARAAYSTVLL